jgi:hypothetical protein
MKLLELLQAMFGKSYLNKVIGTRTNISKPIKLDKSSPFKLYSDKAFDDPKTLDLIEEKLMEYGPYAISNKNMSEVKNFEMNARRYLNAKQGKKPEAEIIDIGTGKKMDDEGIMTLKTELGLPEEVSPKTKMGQNLQELKRLTKETELQKKDIDETMDKGLENIFRTFMQQPSKDTVMEGKRRAVIRKILLNDERITLPKEVRTSLENYDDLRGGGTTEMDPLTIFDTYYKRDTDKLETLDSIIDTAKNEVEAAGEFKFLEDGFELKEKDLGDKLKDLPDDIDPDALAEGGRPGKGVDYLMGL